MYKVRIFKFDMSRKKIITLVFQKVSSIIFDTFGKNVANKNKKKATKANFQYSYVKVQKYHKG